MQRENKRFSEDKDIALLTAPKDKTAELLTIDAEFLLSDFTIICIIF